MVSFYHQKSSIAVRVEAIQCKTHAQQFLLNLCILSLAFSVLAKARDAYSITFLSCVVTQTKPSRLESQSAW